MSKRIFRCLQNMMYIAVLVFAMMLMVPGTLQKVQAEEIEETHDHIFSEEFVTEPATTDADGSIYRVCTEEGCDAKEEETLTVIPKIDSQKLEYEQKVYTGKAIDLPEVIVKDSNGNGLVEGEDYTVEKAKTRTSVGRSKITITYKGKYEGTEELYFTVVPAKPSGRTLKFTNLKKVGGHDDVTFSWNASKGATGYYVYYKKSSATKWTGPVATKNTSYTKKDLYDGTTYSFKVIPYYKWTDGKKYCDKNQYRSITITTKYPGRKITKNYQTYYEYYKGGYSNGYYAKSAFITLDKKTYRFDSKGKMVTGWAKISNKYYYFNRTTGVQVKNSTVDGIKITNGKASATTNNKKKMDLMITARKKMQEITKPTDSKTEKRKKVFKWVMAKKYTMYHYLQQEKKKGGTGWTVTYANDIFNKGKGCCVSEACAFAYLAKECGYTKVYVVDDTSHAWVEIDGKVYDTLFAVTNGFNNYYNSTYKKAVKCHRHNATKI